MSGKTGEAQGRFISEDPIGERGGLNRYAYAGGSPTNFTDARGLAWDLPSLPQRVADSVTGFGDGINLFGFSPSQYIRAGWGISGPCASPAYLAGKDAGDWYATISPFGGRLGYVARVSAIPSIVETVEEAYAERAAIKAEYRSVVAPVIDAIGRDPTLAQILAKAAVLGDEYAIARAGTTNQWWNIAVGAATGYSVGSRALGGN